MKPIRSLSNTYYWIRYGYEDKTWRVGSVVKYSHLNTTANDRMIISIDEDGEGMTVHSVYANNLRRLSALGPFSLTIQL